MAENDVAAVAKRASEIVGATGGDRCLLASDVSVAFRAFFRAALPRFTIAVESGELDRMRMIKDETELGRLRVAAARTDEAIDRIRDLGSEAIGITEAALARRIRTELHDLGATGVAFPVVVATGPNGADLLGYRHGERDI